MIFSDTASLFDRSFCLICGPQTAGHFLYPGIGFCKAGGPLFDPWVGVRFSWRGSGVFCFCFARLLYALVYVTDSLFSNVQCWQGAGLYVFKARDIAGASSLQRSHVFFLVDTVADIFWSICCSQRIVFCTSSVPFCSFSNHSSLFLSLCLCLFIHSATLLHWISHSQHPAWNMLITCVEEHAACICPHVLFVSVSEHCCIGGLRCKQRVRAFGVVCVHRPTSDWNTSWSTLAITCHQTMYTLVWCTLGRTVHRCLVLDSADKCTPQSIGKLYLEIHRSGMFIAQCMPQTTARQLGVDSKTLLASVCVPAEPEKTNRDFSFTFLVSHWLLAELKPLLKRQRRQLHMPLTAEQLLLG